VKKGISKKRALHLRSTRGRKMPLPGRGDCQVPLSNVGQLGVPWVNHVNVPGGGFIERLKVRNLRPLQIFYNPRDVRSGDVF